ncbi:MAG: ribosome maturation factor [Bacteroidota bacterium]|nr:ribosome maturation factor [Bacteroidota bacterium]
MNFDTPLKNIENFVSGITSQSDTTFPVDVKITPGNHITVLLDDDDGITIDKCSQVNKALYKYIEDTAIFGDSNFSLEVSSPGVGEPLKLHRQYKKNIGRSLHIVMNNDSVKEGKLTNANEEEITIEEKEGKGNKAITKQITIQFNQIRHATVLITF